MCLGMQLYFLRLVTMLIPPLQVKDSEVKKTFSSDQPSSSPRDYNLCACIKSAADPTRLSKTYALPMSTTAALRLDAIVPNLRLLHLPTAESP